MEDRKEDKKFEIKKETYKQEFPTLASTNPNIQQRFQTKEGASGSEAFPSLAGGS